jgi:hypothetical protein
MEDIGAYLSDLNRATIFKEGGIKKGMQLIIAFPFRLQSSLVMNGK